MFSRIERFASLKITLFAIVLFAAGILWAYNSGASATWAISAPLFLLTINLIAAVITNEAFYRRLSLLVFHIALVLVVALVAVSRLTSLNGEVEVTEGTQMRPESVGYISGPWHRWKLNEIVFVNNGFTIDYAEGLQRGKTRNKVSWVDDAGEARTMVIGDQHSLYIKGYRFYTTSNKGFAPVFTWIPADGSQPLTGSVHLPSYPLNDTGQAKEWEVPGYKIKVWTMLMLDEAVVDPGKASVFKKPEKSHAFVRVGEDTMKMGLGDKFNLPGGVLVYKELRTWMGYRIFSDWTLPWLIAASVVAVLSVSWYFVEKFMSSPWLSEETSENEL